jgi:hypothetical protein
MISPLFGFSIPKISFNRVVLPVPLVPTIPILSESVIENEALSKIGFSIYLNETLSNVIFMIISYKIKWLKKPFN